MTNSPAFRLGLTRDFLNSKGEIAWGDIGLEILKTEPAIEWDFLACEEADLSSAAIEGYDALIVLSPRVTELTVQDNSRLKLVARFGVGYDNVDLDACTATGVLVTITPDGVRRPVATAAITLLLALSHNLLTKDALVRAGRWGERQEHMGIGVTGRTLGLVGLGNIGREIALLAGSLGLKCLAYDPYVVDGTNDATGVELVELEVLLARADYLCVCCPLNDTTYHLIGEKELTRMKPSSFLINVARGPIVDQVALTHALLEGRIRGAGLDVFETEPPNLSAPIFKCTNVIVAPHSLCWTDELARGNGSSDLKAVLAMSRRQVPEYIVNRAALDHPKLVKWLGLQSGAL
jgi:phosphoglycerate dehydrogenase-like enzyme